MFRIANALLALLFFLAAVLQYNDPDPLRWVLLYGSAGVACALASFRWLPWPLPAAVALVALVWALTLAPHVFGHVQMPELFETWKMKDSRVEVGRETYGLLLVFAWTTVLTIVARRKRRRSAG